MDKRRAGTEKKKGEEEKVTEENGREMPDGLLERTGCCRFCGQIKIMHIAEEWSQEHLDEEATLTCSCSAAQAYAYRKDAVNVARRAIDQLFSDGHRLKWMYKIDLDPSIKPMMLQAVDAMEAGIIDSAAITTGAVNSKLTMRADGKIKVKWDYKDKGGLEL